MNRYSNQATNTVSQLICPGGQCIIISYDYCHKILADHQVSANMDIIVQVDRGSKGVSSRQRWREGM